MGKEEGLGGFGVDLAAREEEGKVGRWGGGFRAGKVVVGDGAVGEGVGVYFVAEFAGERKEGEGDD
jgi:hypothetical protein